MSDYALKCPHGRQTVRIHAADLYLLEQWNDDPSISDETQRSEIFSKWLEIGSRGRLPYVESLEDMHRARDDITDDEKDLLSRVRHLSDRRKISYARLVRTFYGEGSDAAFTELIFDAEFEEPVFDNAMLYDAGPNNGLQSLHEILTRIPQIVDSVARSALFHEKDKKETLEYIKAGLFADDVEATHRAAKWGAVFIYDKEAHDTGGDVLLVYFDDRGRVLRYSRVDGPEDLRDAEAMICSGQDVDHRWWEASDYGEHWEPGELAKRWAEFESELVEEGSKASSIPEEQEE